MFEALCGSTIAWDDAAGEITPHIPVIFGLKELSSTGRTSHLLGATAQFLTEMTIVEVTDPVLHRNKAAGLYGCLCSASGESPCEGTRC
jgi:hypothetical protein